MSVAFLFAGQGSQKIGMGMDLYEKYETFKKVIDSFELDFDVKKCMFEGPAEMLNETQYTQPCMAAFAAGMIALLKENGIKADMAMGLSLGEYSALHAAGVFDAKTLVDLVAFRGKKMQEASKGIECKMSAVLGMDRYKLADVCKQATEEIQKTMPEESVEISNYNCPGQYVITGTVKAVEMAEELAKENGAKRCMALKVSGPFHTSFMTPAGDALKEYFKEINFGTMEFPVLFNTSASTLKDGETIAQLLEKQVQSSIYVEDSINELVKAGITTVIEIGPGKVMTGFVRKITKEIKMYQVEDVASFERLLENKEELN